MLENPKEGTGDKRADIARKSLIMAGLELFGELGFKATTTRMLAKKAGVNIAAIPYYFDSKENLYLEIVKYMMNDADKYFGEFMSRVNKIIEDNSLTKELALDLLKEYTRNKVEFMCYYENAPLVANIVTTEQANPSKAFDFLYDNYISRTYHVMDCLVAAYLGKSVNDPKVRVISHSLHGQVFFFLVTRDNFKKSIGINELSEELIEMIAEVTIANTEACIKRHLEADQVA